VVRRHNRFLHQKHNTRDWLQLNLPPSNSFFPFLLGHITYEQETRIAITRQSLDIHGGEADFCTIVGRVDGRSGDGWGSREEWCEVGQREKEIMGARG